ncbi:MAG: hypothetical protein U1F61_26810 [Opitutaceae bacterium]
MNSTPRSFPLTWRAMLALGFVLVQAGFVVRSRFSTDRFLSWAPHDRQIEYRIEGSVGGSPLSPTQISSRYGLAATGWLSHAAEDLQWSITTRETRLSPGQRASVTLTYRVNGNAWKTWTYP